MSWRTIPVCASAVFLVTTAHAASVTNLEISDRTVTVIEGGTRQDHVLKPRGILDGICNKGCEIRLGDSEDDRYELEGSDVTSIERGELWSDDPDVSADPLLGGADPPSLSGPGR